MSVRIPRRTIDKFNSGGRRAADPDSQGDRQGEILAGEFGSQDSQDSQDSQENQYEGEVMEDSYRGVQNDQDSNQGVGEVGYAGVESNFNTLLEINYTADPRSRSYRVGSNYSFDYKTYNKLPGGSARRYITGQVSRDQNLGRAGLDPITKFYFTYSEVPLTDGDALDGEQQVTNNFNFRIGQLPTINHSRPIQQYLDRDRVDVHWSYGGFEYKAIASEVLVGGSTRTTYAENPSPAPAVSYTLLENNQKVLRWNNTMLGEAPAATKENLAESRSGGLFQPLPYLLFDSSTDWAAQQAPNSVNFNFPSEMLSLAERADLTPVSEGAQITYMTSGEMTQQGVFRPGQYVVRDETEYLQSQITAIVRQRDGNPIFIPTDRTTNALRSIGMNWPFIVHRNTENLDLTSFQNVFNLLVGYLSPGGISNASKRNKKLINRFKLSFYPQEWLVAASENSYQSYQYYNFAAQVPYCKDHVVEKFLSLGGADATQTATIRDNENRQSIDERALPYSTITSNYNYFLREYEDAILNPRIPEAILPNLYLYSLGSRPDPPTPPNSWERYTPEYTQGQEDWEGVDVSERQTNYDELLTLNDALSRVFPLLRGQENGNSFENYLSKYSEAVTGSIDVDFLKNYNRRIGQINPNLEYIIPGDEVDVLAEANVHKAAFPMYVEYSLPTRQGGSLNQLFEESYTTTNIMTAIKNASSRSKSLSLKTRAISVVGELGDAFSSDESPPAEYTEIQMTKDVSIYDFDAWFESIGEPEGIVIQRRNPDNPGAATPATKIAQNLRNIRNYVTDTSREKMIRYDELMRGFKSPDKILRVGGGRNRNDFDNQAYYCETETLMYRVTKSEYVSSQKELVQAYNFFNTSLTEVIRFVDTQVKMKENALETEGADGVPAAIRKQYFYEISAVDVVYGSEFRFRTLDYEVGSTGNGSDITSTDNVYFSFNVETLPCVKVLEYPIFHEDWLFATPTNLRQTAEEDLPDQDVPQVVNGGVCFPPVSILDRPPLAPNVYIIPYKNNSRQVLINFEPAIGKAFGKQAPKYYGLNSDEQEYFESVAARQRITPTGPNGEFAEGLERGRVEVETNNVEEIRRIEAYRVSDLNMEVGSIEEIYFQLGRGLIKALDLDADPDSPESAVSFDFVDDLEPNVRYYYTFRTIDNGGNLSVPSDIYEVELVDNSGVYFPMIRIFTPKAISNKFPKKRVTRFLQITPSDLQKLPFNSFTPGDSEGPGGEQIGIIGSTDDRVESNDFIIRITSIDTGRKIDIRTNFIQRILTSQQIDDLGKSSQTGTGRSNSSGTGQRGGGSQNY